MFKQQVMVYFNLHRKLWSIKSLKTGLVIGHAKTVILSDVKPRVSEAGRQKVLETKQKNVHAGIVGTLESYKDYKESLKDYDEITYNPYKYKTFVYKLQDEIEFSGAEKAIMNNKRVYVTRT